MGKRTLITFRTHEEAEQFDLIEANKTTPSKRLEILAHLINLQKKLPKQNILVDDSTKIPVIRRVK